MLHPSPDLFTAMRVCTFWRDAARSSYRRRMPLVAAVPEALLHAVSLAWPGDTLLLAPGVHRLDTELALDMPLRLLAHAEADTGAWGRADLPPREAAGRAEA